ncbi:MAG TPA: HD domain-containing protein [Saprospiraceae bacterium]|nr:HD domain-containing protein [Saprospiraceae bacterium]
MKKIKIFNDPVYGFITVPDNILMKIIDHPYFQRLRRIKQLGMTHYVYPGALHTRFHHALGALHLMQQAIEVLKMKEVDITDEESLAVQIAILLHDIGHGPFSHALEYVLIDVNHEKISGLFLEELNREFAGQLDVAIDIFYNRYPKAFLHQLISGQLDMDRMDYLNRDSFFTGVSEGIIGYDRIIKMLNVVNDELVVEEKGIYSIEKFLVSRRLMYWQVYLHKTVLAAEQMLIAAVKRAKELMINGEEDKVPKEIRPIFKEMIAYSQNYLDDKKAFLDTFSTWDDSDIAFALKKFTASDDFILNYLSTGLVNRKLFKLEWSDNKFDAKYVKGLNENLKLRFNLNDNEIDYLLITGVEQNHIYVPRKEEIKIYSKDGKVRNVSSLIQGYDKDNITIKYYLCYPKIEKT